MSPKGCAAGRGQKAPLDAQYLITKKENGDRDFWIDKLKDGKDGFGFAFALETIIYGQDEDEDGLSSCTVRYVRSAETEALDRLEEISEKPTNFSLKIDSP